ncbi:alpha-mannosyltransferase [Colletotrichum truncatum]|uniref:Alpha-mannosyltransferase n=1 Tax=Colletotrichum truncatum TaxID=5467 RepID=A0ACC3ZBI2_COLTU|nr:alpha-mannosyltransferase [Colletotrichum truncatum]KAF6787760.1 alpha-mannosyltransferase [Colletotrichum truncatum]
MPAEVISLLSSPSLGPSSAQPALPQSRPPPRAIAIAAEVVTYDEDILDLTTDFSELAPEPAEGVVAQAKKTRPTYSPESVLGTKRPREEQATVNAPVYFMSDDFDTTIDLDSSLPTNDDVERDLPGSKRPCLLPSDIRSVEPSHSTTDQTNRPPLKLSGGLRRAQVLNDPIEFSSSPRFSPKLVQATASNKVSQNIELDDPFASSPPSAQPQPKRQSPPKVTSRPAPTVTRRIDYGLDSDDFLDASLQPVPKPISKPCTITLDDTDDDDDPFAIPPIRAPAGARRPPSLKVTTAPLEKGKQRAESPKRRSNWDPISSSAPERQLPSDPFSPPPPRRAFTKSVSEVIDLSDEEPVSHNLDLASDEAFPDLDHFDATRLKTRIETKKTSHRVSSTTSKPTSARATNKKSADDRAKDKEVKAAERDQEKERKKQEKEAAKEQKAREKERAAALAEVNKVRTDKKISTPEMITDISSSLPAAVTLQIQTLLKDLSVQHYVWESPVDNVIKWRRKVASRFNDELGLWEPIPMRIEPEKFALVIVTASEFVACALGPEGNDLEAHVLKIKRHFPTEQLIYLIEGLNPWMRKNRNVRNRQFVSAVRNQSAEPAEAASAGAQSRRRRNQQQQQEYIDEDSVEDALLELQVMHNVLIHHTNAAVETAQWVAIFTQHISTVPYRKQREAANAAGAGFCMETGQVRTGEDVKDTYVRMLQEIVRITAPIAYGIAAEFETVPKLVKGLEEGGPLVLENLRKSTNKDGGFSERAIGKAVSKRVYKVFTGQDEWSTDV